MAPRARCACGRARRAAAAKCQRCLDADRLLAARISEPMKWARDWRAMGCLCAFIGEKVYVVKRKGTELGRTIRELEIDGGRWARVIVLEDWKLVDAPPGGPLRTLLAAIARDCYCSSFPDSGCDFCNGTRLPDGAEP